MKLQSPLPRKIQHRGFSLAELLIVITVIAFLLAMAAPNIFSLMRSNELSTQGDIFHNRLTLAQQQALSTNADVEVRFYKYKDDNNAQPTEEFRAMQFFQYDKEGKLAPISELFILNDPIVFGTGQFNGYSLSSVLTERGTDLQADVKRFGSGVSRAVYRSFRFHPDGSTNLNSSSNNSSSVQPIWHITMVEERPSTQQTQIYNYFSVQIDPFNGSLREYRP